MVGVWGYVFKDVLVIEIVLVIDVVVVGGIFFSVVVLGWLFCG